VLRCSLSMKTCDQVENEHCAPWDFLRASAGGVQGCLTQKKPPPPPRATIGPYAKSCCRFLGGRCLL